MSKSQNHLFGLPDSDLAHVLHLASVDLESLRGKRIFLTGGTGFFGKWLLASLYHAQTHLKLGLSITILSRDPAAFLRRHPDADIACFNFVRGHISDFTLAQGADYVLHAATDTTAFRSDDDERERSRAIVAGMRHVLDFAKNCGSRFLNISSGAVYGAAASQPTGAKEDDFAQATALTPYGIAKREAEMLCVESGVDFVTARAFAFLGPYLPLDAHFAAGNFLRDAVRGGPIVVRGDGTALRSYLHPADLVVWLLRLLVRGERGTAYNVGSDENVTTAQLANLIAKSVRPHAEVIIQSTQPLGSQNIYLPNILRARNELYLQVAIPLPDAIARTLNFISQS